MYFFLPIGIKKRISEKKQGRELRLARERAKRTRVSKEEVEKIIQGLDIGDSDIILHSSIMDIGKIDGGVKWVAKCLFDKINLNERTILVSALPYRGKFKDYLERCELFDVRTAPIEMGGINEYIGTLPEAQRSIHPTHSIVAVGKNAEDYVKDHHLDKTPFGTNSPYYKIIKNRGKAVMFGTSWEHYTSIHAVEDMLGNDYPGRIYSSKRYLINCINNKGDNVIVETPYHNLLKSCIRMMSPLKPKLLDLGIMRVTPIGESSISVIDMYKFTLFYLEELKHGRSIYGHVSVSPYLKNKIENIEKTL